MTRDALERSRALWNRGHLDLASDEVLAQLLDRGEVAAHRELYAIAKADPDLRRRMLRVLYTVPVALPYFWLAALASLGEQVDYDAQLPAYEHESWV